MSRHLVAVEAPAYRRGCAHRAGGPPRSCCRLTAATAERFPRDIRPILLGHFPNHERSNASRPPDVAASCERCGRIRRGSTPRRPGRGPSRPTRRPRSRRLCCAHALSRSLEPLARPCEPVVANSIVSLSDARMSKAVVRTGKCARRSCPEADIRRPVRGHRTGGSCGAGAGARPSRQRLRAPGRPRRRRSGPTSSHRQPRVRYRVERRPGFRAKRVARSVGRVSAVVRKGVSASRTRSSSSASAGDGRVRR